MPDECIVPRMNKRDQSFSEHIVRWMAAILLFACFGCLGGDCFGKKNVNQPGMTTILAVNRSSAVEGNLDFASGTDFLGVNVEFNQQAPKRTVPFGSRTVSVALHGSSSVLQSLTMDFGAARTYCVMAYDGDPGLKLMARDLVPPNDLSNSAIYFMNGDHLRGAVDVYVTSGTPPGSREGNVPTIPGESTSRGSERREVTPGSYFVYGCKTGTLEVIWSVPVEARAGKSYLVSWVNEGTVSFDPEVMEITP
jgi:hypothetical protein